MELCSEEQTLNTVVATKLGPLQQAYEVLNAAVMDRMGQLQGKLVQFQEVDDSLADILRWLVEIERTVSRQEPISLQPLKVNRQKNDQEVSTWHYFVDCFILTFSTVLNAKKIIAVRDATYAVTKRKPEKFSLAGIRALIRCDTGAIPVPRSNKLSCKPTGSWSLNWVVIYPKK